MQVSTAWSSNEQPSPAAAHRGPAAQLDPGRRRGTDHLRGHRRGVFARRVPGADEPRHRLVACRNFHGDDAGVPEHGHRRLRLGRAERPLRPTAGRPGRNRAAGPFHRARQPRHEPAGIPARFWLADGRRRRQLLRSGDRHDCRVVRPASQPRGFAGHGRDGRGTDDHFAAGGVAGHAVRLAHGATDDRHRCLAPVAARGLVHPGRTVRGARARRVVRCGAGRAVARGAALARVPRARGDLLRLLRSPLGADLPHRELRDRLRLADGHGKAPRVWRDAWCSACSGTASAPSAP